MVELIKKPVRVAQKKVKVLIIDDSALVRNTLSSIFNSDDEIQVIGTASDPYVAVEKLREEVPDVISLDVEMPRMDGITFLSKLMSQHPIPVVIISTLTERSAENAILAMEYGAVEVIAKPKLGTKQHLESARAQLCNKIKAASMSHVRRRGVPKYKNIVPPRNTNSSPLQTTEIVIAIGASTGGTEAIRTILMDMPLDCPGIIITQHMPEVFTSQFAKRLDQLCSINVREAKHGDTVLRGTALIAPGHSHMCLKRSGTRYYVELNQEPLVNNHRPSVDVLFRSVAQYAGKNSIGVILTGMGGDGAKGLKELYDQGAYTIAQNESSCVVYGMPKEAVKLGAVTASVSLEKITNQIINESKKIK
ncbi:MAG: chemotaxis response regulator protein-glutamate methylesterase [Rickettsiales bacterium]|nr:chemotaxis response regulator protein-glutamate methylesterase [Rickettsiales bacterium]